MWLIDIDDFLPLAGSAFLMPPLRLPSPLCLPLSYYLLTSTSFSASLFSSPLPLPLLLLLLFRHSLAINLNSFRCVLRSVWKPPSCSCHCMPQQQLAQVLWANSLTCPLPPLAAFSSLRCAPCRPLEASFSFFFLASLCLLLYATCCLYLHSALHLLLSTYCSPLLSPPSAPVCLCSWPV